MSHDLTTTEAPPPLTVEQADRLLAKLASSKGQGRVEAEQALAALGEEDVRIIHQILLQRIRKWNLFKRKSDGRVLWYVGGTLAALLLPWPLKPFLGMEAVQMLAFSSFGIVLFAMLVEGFVCAGKIQAGQAAFEHAVTALARTPTAALSPLLPQLYTMSRQPSEFQKPLLEALLKVQESDAALFTSIPRRQLLSILEKSTLLVSGQKPELAVAALRVLRILGDYSAIPTVKRVSEEAMTPSIRDAAVRCYTQLTAEASAPENILLRGSASPDVPADILLRAFSGAGTTQPEELLRASQENVTSVPIAQPARLEHSPFAANEATGQEEAKPLQVGLTQDRTEDR